MYDTGVKNNWNTLKIVKVEGNLNRDRLEDLKKRIDQPIRKEDVSLNRTKDNRIDENIDRTGVDVSGNVYENQKGSKKFIKWMKDLIKDPAYMNLQKDSKNVFIRPEFDDLRGKLRDGVGEKISQVSKTLQITGEDQILQALSKNHDKNKKTKYELQRLEARKDPLFGAEDEKEPKNDGADDEDFIDFKKLNQEKVDRIARENLNRVLPSDIENIQKLEEKKYLLMPALHGQTTLRPDSYEVHPQLEKKPFYQEDTIEYYSIVADKANKLNPIPFYREIGPVARDLINPKNDVNVKNNKLALDMMSEKELHIDDKNITFDNIINIVTGRIPQKKLQKVLQHLDYAEESDENEDADAINDFLPPQAGRNKRPRDKGLKIYEFEGNNYGSYRKNGNYEKPRRGKAPPGEQNGYYDQFDHPNYNENYNNFNEESYTDNSQSNKNESMTDHKITSRIIVEVEDYEQQFPTPRDPAEEVRIDRETQTEQVAVPLSTEGDNSEARSHEEQNVNTLLTEIENLKAARSDSYKLPKSPALVELRQVLNSKIEDRLASLLYLIADDPERTNKLKDNLELVIKDIHLLEGKVLDGHLKKNLLFQFLKEHRKLIEEREHDQQKEELIQPERVKDRDEKFETPQQRTREVEDFRSYGTRVASPPDMGKYNTRRSNFSPPKRKTTEKLTQQNSLKSQKLPQPVGVKRPYMKQTQSSLRRLKDVEETHPKLKPYATIEERERDKGMWIGANEGEDISDDDEWVQI